MSSKFFAFGLSTLALGLSSALLISGCSAHVDGGAPGGELFPPGPSGFANSVDGPALDGTWKSVCVDDARSSNTWDLITMTFAGQNVTRKVDLYSDASCTKFLRTKTEQGLFRYESLSASGVYAIDYRFNMTNGTYTQYENFRPDGTGILWISNEIGGDASADVKLTKDGASNKPTPTPAPGATPISSIVTIGSHVASYGDEVSLKGTANGAVQTEVYTNQGFDSSAGTWTVYRDIEGAQIDMGYSYVASVWTSAKTQDMFTNCTANGGVSEVITVPAGSFQTCMINNGSRKTWYGDVPLWGKVKIEDLDGTFKTELQSYTWAK
jgi:hypothetical protein